MSPFTAQGTVEAFAHRLEHEWRAWIARQHPGLDMSQGYRVTVKPGPKYTKVDVGDSGKYMVVNATGNIYGIKGYGVIHRGHAYGTLATVKEWDWGGYVAQRRTP